MRRTNKDFFNHLEELTLKNEQLKQENQGLRAENRRLRSENSVLYQRVQTLEATLEERINAAVEEAVWKAVAPLKAEIERKDAEILRLKAIINYPWMFS